MRRTITALLGIGFGVASVGAAPSTAQDPEAEIRACQSRCASIEDETDRATCRLNCRETTEEKDRAHIIRWKKERSIGGGVAGETPPPATVTTLTKVTPRGTTTESNAPATKTPEADTRSPRQRYYFGLVDCQERCDPIGVDLDRARCKLRCLRQRPGPPPPRTSPAMRN